VEANAGPFLSLWKHQVHWDERGFLVRIFEDAWLGHGEGLSIQQVNVTETTAAGMVRGLHVQLPPSSEWKLVTCLQGKVYDVVADLRHTSPTFGHWDSLVLSGETPETVVIPPGCAHGFQALTDHARLLYLHTDEYHPQQQGRLNPLSSDLGINWPLPVSLMSEADRLASGNLAEWRRLRW
jgi:dTDP-4-dehydrorhamnose 3,5-epimerase